MSMWNRVQIIRILVLNASLLVLGGCRRLRMIDLNDDPEPDIERERRALAFRCIMLNRRFDSYSEEAKPTISLSIRAVCE